MLKKYKSLKNSDLRYEDTEQFILTHLKTFNNIRHWKKKKVMRQKEKGMYICFLNRKQDNLDRLYFQFVISSWISRPELYHILSWMFDNSTVKKDYCTIKGTINIDSIYNKKICRREASIPVPLDAFLFYISGI